MTEDLHYYQQLLDRYLNNTCTPREAEELLDYLGGDASARLLLGKMQAEYALSMEHSSPMPGPIAEKIRSRLMQQVEPAPVVPIYRRRFFRVAAAAVIFILLAAGGYYVLLDKPAARDAVTKTQPATDVKPPETNRATITLASGETIYLDSAANGTLVKQKDMEVTKLADGRIVYKGNSSDMVFNTLTNPRGSQVIDITLSDGTRAWLNAGSSITYPVVFAGSNREVTINGEAYFEVAHNPQKPFRVGKGTMSVSVLGTHFNVNAYDDEADIKVTLLEGAVKVNQENNSKELKPGQQARINSEITIANEVNIAQVMAWKNGKFDFGEGTALTDIMRQVARWYDVDIEYRGKVEQEFWGTMSRQVNVSKVLEKFELTDRVHFKIEGKKIIVYP